MIDVIIPAYNAIDTIEETLFSIAYQDMVDKINVYVVDDCSDCDYSEIISFFSNFMRIELLKLEKNSGPGVARKYGINNSSSPYIIFIDSDDVFFDMFSISRLYNAINNNDVVISNFIEEINGEFIDHERDTIWLHGKIYKREFLDNNSINFNDSRLNEDNGFNQLIMLSDAKIKYINFKTYIWCNNKNSITRINNYSNLYDLFLGYIYNIGWALDESIKRGFNNDKISGLSFSALVLIYCHYLYFNGKKEIIDKSIHIKEISDAYPVSFDRRNRILENQYKLFYKSGNKCLLDPFITFSDFLKLFK